MKRDFPSDHCNECKRVTGTDFDTGLCGGCILKHTNFPNEIDEYHDKLDWQDITMLVIVGALVAWIIIRAMFTN